MLINSTEIDDLTFNEKSPLLLLKILAVAKQGNYNQSVRTSIIIPTLNESSTIGKLSKSLSSLDGDFEVIVADGGSSDNTVEVARRSGLKVVEAPRGRGPQMNAGARAACGEILVFLHADTQLPSRALSSMDEALRQKNVSGGNFNLIFGGESREAKWLTRIYPFLRLIGMSYGDSAIFTRKETFDSLGGYKNYPIFEDSDLYKRLRRIGRFVHLKENAVTSSRRFEGRFLRTFSIWAVMHVLYWVGVSPDFLNRIYRPIR